MYRLTIYKPPADTSSIITIDDIKGYMIQEVHNCRTLCKIVKTLKEFNVSIPKREIKQDIKKHCHHIGGNSKNFYSVTKTS